MLRQGRLKLDQFLREVQSGLGRAGQGVVASISSSTKVASLIYVMGPQDGQIVQQVLALPSGLLRSGCERPSHGYLSPAEQGNPDSHQPDHAPDGHAVLHSDDAGTANRLLT
jgi:hypothetical protein